jgi:hypothetical protein
MNCVATLKAMINYHVTPDSNWRATKDIMPGGFYIPLAWTEESVYGALPAPQTHSMWRPIC